MMLDRKRPYNEVVGLSGIAYEQGGRYFNNAGTIVERRLPSLAERLAPHLLRLTSSMDPDDRELAREIEAMLRQIDEKGGDPSPGNQWGAIDSDGISMIDAAISVPPVPIDTLDGLDKAHWKHLKPRVEALGGTWTTREEAIKFLRGRHSE